MRADLSPVGFSTAARGRNVPLLMAPRHLLLLPLPSQPDLLIVNIRSRATHITIIMTEILSHHGIPHGGINE